MHIPDGFLSPQTYLPAYALAAAAWSWAGKNLRDNLNEVAVPRLALLTALAYGLSLIMLPIPGGSSGHILGIALLALIFGVRMAFLAYSLVLLLQALLLGAGGITALPINALALGLVGSSCAVGARWMFRVLGNTASVAIAAWVSVVVPAILVACILGVQPLIASAPDGSPLFFPFGVSVTLPALVIPHLFIGVGEAVLTVLVLRYAEARKWPTT